MAYTHSTFAAAKTALAARLGDTGMVYWVDAELGEYFKEALQVWGLLTGYWRDRGTFNTSSGVAFYDITTLQNGAAEDLLSYTVTDTTLSTRIQYHLLEPATGSTWTGSEQFTLADVTDALTRRRDMFLVDSRARFTRTTQALGSGVLHFDVPETTLSVTRVAWTAGSTTYPLVPEDVSSQRSYSDSYLNTPGTPDTFSSSSVRPLRHGIAPPPNRAGTLDFTLIQSGAALTAGGVVVGVPDDMTWVVKVGAMADMLGKEGPGMDLPRSYFCERRYRLGVELARVAPTVLNAQINGIDLATDSITNLDRFDINWQSTTGTPTFIASLRNFVALATCPDGSYGVLLDVVRKAPLPSADGDFIQIGKEYLNNILDYAEHLAAFKCGGQEFRHSFRAADSFFNAALGYNQRLAAQSPALLELIRQSTLDDYDRAPRSSAGPRVLIDEVRGASQRDQMQVE